MHYVLTPKMLKTLTSLDGFSDNDITEIKTKVGPDEEDGSALYFRVVLEDGFPLEDTSNLETGRRLEDIAVSLRRRAIKAGVPVYSFVSFMKEEAA